jgi:hypothetical protein
MNRTATLTVYDSAGKPKSLVLNDNDLEIIATAVSVVMRSGGGSPEWDLLMRLRKVDVDADDDRRLRRYCNTVLEEAEEVGAIKMLERF